MNRLKWATKRTYGEGAESARSGSSCPALLFRKVLPCAPEHARFDRGAPALATTPIAPSRTTPAKMSTDCGPGSTRRRFQTMIVLIDAHDAGLESACALIAARLIGKPGTDERAW